jgi:hypothetical protein
MNRLSSHCFNYLALCGLAFCLFGFITIQAQQPDQEPNGKAELKAPKVMREYRGVRLGMASAEVRAALGKPERAGDQRDEYEFDGHDLLTVHYQNGQVRAIQLYFNNSKKVPSWTEVVGEAEITQNENGSKLARVSVNEENFWVSMFQNKDQSVTTITISR